MPNQAPRKATTRTLLERAEDIYITFYNVSCLRIQGVAGIVTYCIAGLFFVALFLLKFPLIFFSL